MTGKKPKWWWSRTRRLEWELERHIAGIYASMHGIIQMYSNGMEQQGKVNTAIVEAFGLLCPIIANIITSKAKDDVPISH